MTLATYGSQGLWAAAVFYASDAFNLYFISAGHTRHGQNLVANARVAVTIQEDYVDWPEIKGIQLEGVVELLGGQARIEAIALYQAKYPFIQTAGENLRAALDAINWYCLTPDRFYFIDNSKGFGHRDEIV
jgi:uncharacterized protein YhbP (UPF0306 family)